MEKYFTNVVGIGDLYLDYIFFEFEDEPILFVCVDRCGYLYLCICTEIRYEQDWVITLVDQEQLTELVQQRRDIQSIFAESKKIIFIKMSVDKSESSKQVSYEKLDPLELPDQGVYFPCDVVGAMSYIQERGITFREVVNSEERMGDHGLNVDYESRFMIGVEDDLFVRNELHDASFEKGNVLRQESNIKFTDKEQPYHEKDKFRDKSILTKLLCVA